MIRLPNKDYWVSEENRPTMESKMQSLISEFGAVFLGLSFLIKLLTISANLADPVKLNASLFYAILVAFFLYVTYVCVKPLWAFAVPKHRQDR